VRRVVDVADDHMCVHVLDRGAGAPAVTAARAKTIKAHFVPLARPPEGHPEVCLGGGGQVEQVGDVRVRHQQQVQAGAPVGELVRRDRPVRRPVQDLLVEVLGAEDAHTGGLEGQHVGELVVGAVVAQVVHARS
jgi:hypothetical protein